MANVKIINIGPWDSGDSGLTHYATTWQVSDNLNFSNVLLEETSEEQLNTWIVELAIPSDSIYYVRAKRHFKDSNGNEVDNPTWLGPEPIIETAEVSIEPLKPKVYVEDPYVEFISVDPDNGLKLKAIEPQDGIGVTGVDWIIRVNNKVVYSEMNKTDDMFNLTVSNDIYNFTATKDIEVLVRYRGHLGSCSKFFRDKIEISKTYYKFDKDLNNIPINEDFELKLISTTDNGITVLGGYLLNLDKTVETNLSIKDNTITIPSNPLKPNSSYILSLNIQYIEPVSGKLITENVEHYIKTMRVSENQYFNFDFDYVNGFKFLKDVLVDDLDLNIDILQVSEQMITGLIPMLNSNKKLDLELMINSGENLRFKTMYNLGLTYDAKQIKFELLPNYIGLFGYITNDDKIKLDFYKYDVYKETFTLLKTHEISDKSVIKNNNFFLINNDLHFIEITGEKSVTIKKINLLDPNLKINIVKTFDINTDVELTEIIVNLIDYDTVTIIPIPSLSTGRCIIYDFSRDDITEGPTIPAEYRNISLLSFNLLNGNVLYFRKDDPRSFMVYNRKQATFTVYENDIIDTKPFNGFIKLKNGNILAYYKDKNKNDEDVYEFYMYY